AGGRRETLAPAAYLSANGCPAGGAVRGRRLWSGTCEKGERGKGRGGRSEQRLDAIPHLAVRWRWLALRVFREGAGDLRAFRDRSTRESGRLSRRDRDGRLLRRGRSR